MYSCCEMHQFNDADVKEWIDERAICPYCWPNGFRVYNKDKMNKFIPEITNDPHLQIKDVKDLSFNEMKIIIKEMEDVIIRQYMQLTAFNENYCNNSKEEVSIQCKNNLFLRDIRIEELKNSKEYREANGIQKTKLKLE